ncbi:hypothetical protein SUGI_1181340 [Cryptomeria japonica]|nr:hypothetical protein SUGI_1181340 [Cryptomeria japonica]
MVINNLEANINASFSNYFNTSEYDQSPDRVYGLLQCYGEATAEECFSFSQDIATQIREKCGNATAGNYLLDNYFMRYESYSFFGILDITTFTSYRLAKIMDEPEVFRKEVRELLTNLADEALGSPIQYSSRFTTTSTFIPIYSLLQCWGI